MRSASIYSITCTENGRIYIGSTIRSPRQRWLEHLHYLRKGTHHSKHLQRCYAKHGEQSMEFSVIESVEDANFALAREQFHIWRNEGRLLNSVPVSDSTYAAHAAVRGRIVTEEERKRRSAALKKAHESIDMKAVTSTPERRAALRRGWEKRREATGDPFHMQLWIKLYQEGKTISAIAACTEVAKVTVSKWLKAKGVFDNSRRIPRTDEQKTKAVQAKRAYMVSEGNAWAELYKSGVSLRQIEAQTGRCRRSIANELKRRGVM